MYTQQHFSNKNKNNKNASKTINTVKPSMKDHPNDRAPLIKTHLKIFCNQISTCKNTFKTIIFPLNCSCIRPRFWKPFYPFKATFWGRVFHCTGFLLPSNILQMRQLHITETVVFEQTADSVTCIIDITGHQKSHCLPQKRHESTNSTHTLDPKVLDSADANLS